MSDTMNLFEKAPVPQAVLKNALPAMAAMLMVLIYNLADTFFISQTHSDILVAAVSLATPVFLIFMAVGTVFGIGGTSVISRAFGQGRAEYAKKVCSFCMWGCVAVGIAMSAAFLIFMEQILALIGASADTWEPAKTYLTIVALGGPFVLVSNCYSNILRAEGQPNKAMIGQILGNLLNVVLDPIMILGFHWGIAGAAIATVIGNMAGAGYYILYFLQGKSTLSIHIRDFSVKGQIFTGVLAIGIPASLGSLLMSVSQIIVNARMAGYGDMALAGMGVAMKVTMMTGMVCIGFGQGVQPLLGYCVGAKLWERFKKIMRFSVIFALGLSTVMTGLCYLLRGSIIRVFLTEPASFDYALAFTNILLTTSFLFGVFYVLTNALQAMGAAVQALIINLSRQGIIYIPALFLLQTMLQANGLAWAQPVADLLSTALVALLYLWTSRKMMAVSSRVKILTPPFSFKLFLSMASILIGKASFIEARRKEVSAMRVQKAGIALLLLLSGCASMGAAPPEKTEEDELSIAALFQTENGDTLNGSAACFTTEADSEHCQVDSEGVASVSGLPRSGELLLTLFDPQQEVQGAMTLSFDQGAVIDATTGQDGVGHITVRNDTSEVALIFILTEDGTLQCMLWLERTVPPNTDHPQKGA